MSLFLDNDKQPEVVKELTNRLRVMLDQRGPASVNNVINFNRASERSKELLSDYQGLVGVISHYFHIPDQKVDYQDYQEFKSRISDLEDSAKSKEKTGKGKKIGDKVGEFIDTASRARVAGIKKLSNNQLEYACAAAQQLEAEIQQKEEMATSQLHSEQAGKDSDEIKTEKELALQAQLPFKKEKKLLMTLKTDLENALRARQTSTPKPGMS